MRQGRFVPSVVLGLLLLAASPAPPVYAQAAVATAPAGLPMARPESVGLNPDALAKMDEGMQGLVDKRHLAGIVSLAVGAVLFECDDPDVPWQRIVRSDGSLARGERQRKLLEAEGVPFRGDRVDMRAARLPDLY